MTVRKDKPLLTLFLSYERLLDFCMNYDLLDHVARECLSLPQDVRITPQIVWKYKKWIDAQSLVKPRRPSLPYQNDLGSASSPAKSLSLSKSANSPIARREVVTCKLNYRSHSPGMCSNTFAQFKDGSSLVPPG